MVNRARSLAADSGKLIMISAPENSDPHRYLPLFGEEESWLSRNSKLLLKFGSKNLALIVPVIALVMGLRKKGAALLRSVD